MIDILNYLPDIIQIEVVQYLIAAIAFLGVNLCVQKMVVNK